LDLGRTAKLKWLFRLRSLEPVRRKVESGEAVVIPWSALLFRRRADVES
jgi:hypothetical protein